MKDRLTLWLFFLNSVRCTLLAGFGQKVILLGAPFHWNLGDHAQTYCTVEWMKDNYPNKKLLVYDTRSAIKFNYLLMRALKFFANDKDIYILHSGYHLTDLYPLELDLQLRTISDFPDSKIIVMPQTINLTTKEVESRVIDCFNEAKDLTLLCRDETSYELAKKFFSCKLLLFPDIVTSMIGQEMPRATTRTSINLCLRNDKESLYRQSGEDLRMVNELSKIDKVVVTDTEAAENPFYVRLNLAKVLQKSWFDFSSYKVTITDRYHGTIFSLIAGTPVVVIASTDHKLISGVKWFPKKYFKDYVFYAKDADEAILLVGNIYQNNYTNRLEPYFKKNYYSSLKSKLI